MAGSEITLLKAHVKGYTNAKGTFVAEHDDKRQAAKPGAVPPPHAHVADLRAEGDSRKGNGTQDAEAFHSLADHLEAGDHKSAGQALRHMDTEPRDAALSHVHPSHWKALGFDALHPEKSEAEFNKLHPPEKAAPGSKVVTKPAAPAAPAKPAKAGKGNAFEKATAASKAAMDASMSAEDSGGHLAAFKAHHAAMLAHNDAAWAPGVSPNAQGSHIKYAQEHLNRMKKHHAALDDGHKGEAAAFVSK